jgi:single-strand DNA-binding protein
MAGVNKAIIIGRLGRDPETKYTSDGTAITNFSVATSEEWKDKHSGEKKEKTEWHRIVAYRKLAEICSEYLAKGRQVYIEGRIQTREWEDNNGNKRTVTEIVASDVRFLGGAGAGDARPQTQKHSTGNVDGKPYVSQHGEDEIPF